MRAYGRAYTNDPTVILCQECSEQTDGAEPKCQYCGTWLAYRDISKYITTILEDRTPLAEMLGKEELKSLKERLEDEFRDRLIRTETLREKDYQRQIKKERRKVRQEAQEQAPDSKEEAKYKKLYDDLFDLHQQLLLHMSNNRQEEKLPKKTRQVRQELKAVRAEMDRQRQSHSIDMVCLAYVMIYARYGMEQVEAMVRMRGEMQGYPRILLAIDEYRESKFLKMMMAGVTGVSA